MIKQLHTFTPTLGTDVFTGKSKLMGGGLERERHIDLDAARDAVIGEAVEYNAPACCVELLRFAAAVERLDKKARVFDRAGLFDFIREIPTLTRDLAIGVRNIKKCPVLWELPKVRGAIFERLNDVFYRVVDYNDNDKDDARRPFYHAARHALECFERANGDRLFIVEMTTSRKAAK